MRLPFRAGTSYIIEVWAGFQSGQMTILELFLLGMCLMPRFTTSLLLRLT